VAASVTRRRTRQALAGTISALAVLVCAAGPATAQDRNPTFSILSIPTISGTPVVGNLLTASGGAWQSPSPNNTSTQWQWWRCSNPFAVGCQLVSQNSQTYRLTDQDTGAWIATARWIRHPAKADCNPESECLLSVSAAHGPVSVVATPAPTPVPTPAATPEPTPEPFVATPAPAPASVQRAASTTLRTMRPQPTVRMRGTLTLRGARVTLFSVRVGTRAHISVTCKGAGCPRKTYSTRQRTVRLRAFERYLPARTRIEVRVRRAGYYGKSTVLVIRRGKAPYRLDRCVSASDTYTACPEPK